jgi:hypothetical protein
VDARCTRGARVIFQAVPTTLYICDVHVGGAQCDEYSARLRKGRPPLVTLRRRRVDCILPGV